MSEQVLARIEGGVGRLTLNRPEQRNAMSVEMSTLLRQKLRDMEQDTAIRCIVLDGAGEHFVAGGEVDGIAACAGEADFLEAVTAFPQKRPPKFG